MEEPEKAKIAAKSKMLVAEKNEVEVNQEKYKANDQLYKRLNELDK